MRPEDASGVTLVPVGPEHAEAAQRLIVSDRAIVANTRMPDPYPAGGAARWVAVARPQHDAGEAFTFSVLDAAGAFVGAVGLFPSEDRYEAEVGYWIGAPFWGRGYATAAVRQTLAFAFEEVGVARVFAVPLEPNAASRRVLSKAGLRLVRFLPNDDPAKWGDARMAEYEMTRIEWARVSG